MKKALVVLICLMFIPFVYAKENVEIQSIELVDHTEGLVAKDPVFEGLDINYDIAFRNVDDYAKYKVTIKNNTNQDYIVNNTNKFDESAYFKYEFDSFEDVKANDTSTIYLTITYNKEIDSSAFVNDKYSESKKAVVELLNENGEKVNPNTSTNAWIFAAFILTLVVFIVAVNLLKTEKVRYYGIVLLLLAIPMMVKAVETLKININVNVSIQRGYKVVYKTYLPVWYTEVEKNALDSETYCSAREYYDSNNNRYYFCEVGYTYEDPQKYYEGETVTVKRLKKEFTSCTGAWENHSGKIICNGDVGTVNLSNYEQGAQFEYNKYVIENNGFTYNDNDVNLFEFKSNHDYYVADWNDNGHFEVLWNTKFTMPNHDMFFIYSEPEE